MREKDPNYVPGAPATAARPPAVGTAAGAAMEALPTGLAVRPFQMLPFRSAFHVSPKLQRALPWKRCPSALRCAPLTFFPFTLPVTVQSHSPPTPWWWPNGGVDPPALRTWGASSCDCCATLAQSAGHLCSAGYDWLLLGVLVVAEFLYEYRQSRLGRGLIIIGVCVAGHHIASADALLLRTLQTLMPQGGVKYGDITGPNATGALPPTLACCRVLRTITKSILAAGGMRHNSAHLAVLLPGGFWLFARK